VDKNKARGGLKNRGEGFIDRQDRWGGFPGKSKGRDGLKIGNKC
jgi:hypothetical protein